tara:strand:+ start:28585 stop:29700 length:1116 start_codon:yes stop_codon:yes gene_type:complete
MLVDMTRIAAICVFTCVLASLTAQQSLKELEMRFRGEMQQLDANSPTRQQQDELFNRHVAQLRTFLQSTAKGDDRWNGRLWLAELELVRGKRQEATEVLKEIDADQAPGMVLVSGASMAQHLNLVQLRDEWVQKSVTKDAPLLDRMAMARLLMTVLREIELGEGLFTKALANAKDDEEKAFVMWHRADALRDREDLPENTGFDELEKLAKALPETYWGSVAKDRLRATRLRVGDDPIAITGKTLGGETFSTKAQLGRAVVLAFYTAADYDTPRLLALLADLQDKNKDLAVLGICLDRDVNEIKKSVKSLGIRFPVIGDGKGPGTDAALRWFVEGPVVHVLDKAGKVAGLGLQAGTNDGRAEMIDVIKRAMR